MSNYRALTKHPETGEIEMAEWLDKYYANHIYGVRFSDGSVWHEDKVYPHRSGEDKEVK